MSKKEEKTVEIEEIEEQKEEVEESKVEKKENKDKKETKKTKKPKKTKDVAEDLDEILYGEGRPEDIDLGEVPEFITGKSSGKDKNHTENIPDFLKY